MFWFVLLPLLISEDPRAIKVLPDDPVIAIQVQDLQGKEFTLPDVLDTSFCFILSTACPQCQEALSSIETLFTEQQHTVILFLDTAEQVKRFLAKRGPRHANLDIYTVEESELTPYNVKFIPALLSYKKSLLTFAFYGPLPRERAQRMVDWYGRQFGYQ